MDAKPQSDVFFENVDKQAAFLRELHERVYGPPPSIQGVGVRELLESAASNGAAS
jgi:hypothetical protein